jgi:uncharacterized protein involved in outer membrane biogenesis
MKKALLGTLAVLLVTALAAIGYGVHLAGRLNTPEFQKSLLGQAKAAVGAEVRVQTMDISLFSGVTLSGLAIANPAPFGGDLLTADAFVLRYRLRPLLAGRVEVERVALEKPSLDLAMDAKGAFNYEKLGGRAPSKPSAAAPAGAAAVPLRLVLKQLAVENGSVTMADHTKARLLAVEGAGFRSAFEVEGGVVRGSGEASLAEVSVADLLFLRSVRAPLSLSKETVTLSPIRADVAKGRATGDVTVHLKGGFRYVARLEVKGVDVSTLLAEAKSAGGVAGTLAAQATFEGSGGLPTMKGRGQGTVSDCRVEQGRVLALLATVLQVPELANPDFDECRAEFTQSGSRLSTPVLLLTGEAVQMRGAGTVNLETTALDYQMTLALAPRLFAKVTRPELRPAFKQRADGYATVDFRLFGTTTDPKTDLLARVGTAAATDAVKKGLDRLFGSKDQ